MSCMIEHNTRHFPYLAPQLGVALLKQEVQMTSERIIARDARRIPQLDVLRDLPA